MTRSDLMRVDKKLKKVIADIAKETGRSQVVVSRMAANEIERMELLKKRKKGQADNIALIIVAFFVFAVVMLPVFWMLDVFNTEAQTLTEFNNTGGEILQDQTDRFPAVFDGLALFILVGLSLALIGSAFLVDAQPFFYVISFIIFIFVLILAAILANVWDALRDSPVLASQAANFPITNFLFDNYVAVFTLIGSVSFIVLYSKLRG